jgi:hypothetical protein
MRARMIGPRCAFTVLLVLAATPERASAFHTVFSFEVDRFEADGNAFGPLDGSPGFVDDFDDGSLAPAWYEAYGTASESGSSLFLTNPGTHYPTPDGGTADVSIAASSSAAWVYDGSGDFVATSWWVPLVPTEGNHYQMSVFTFSGGGGPFYNEAFGIGILNFAIHGGLALEQHLTEIDQANGIFQNTMIDFVPIDAGDITGQIGFRVTFDDATNTVTSSVSLDGGATWQSPFPPGPIFVGRNAAQFLLSSDPEISSGTTTTTTPGSTTTSTTLPLGACDPSGCRRSIVPFKSRLAIKDKLSDRGDSITWKMKKGEATTFPEFGVPSGATSYDVCLKRDSTGETIFQATIPAGGTCGTKYCWKAVGGARGWRYKNGTGTPDGIRLLTLRAGEDGKVSVAVRGKGELLSLPDLPLSLPVTARLRASNGTCWANTFTAAAVVRSSDTKFIGKAASPSGAFLD